MKQLHQLRTEMRNCPQTDTQNVLQHGISVANYFRDLSQHIHCGTPLRYQWKLPHW